MRPLDDGTWIHRCAMVVRVLQEQTERVREVLVSKRVRRTDLQTDPKRLCPASQHVQRLRKAPIRHQEQALLPRSRFLRLDPKEHRHRLGRRSAFVEERCGRDVGTGEILDDRLEIEQRLEPALGDLGLIGRVRRVPGRILEDVSKDHARRDAPVVAHPDVGAGNDVALGDPPKTPQVLVLAVAAWKVERRRCANAWRNRLVDERVERRDAHDPHHLVASCRVGSDVS